MLSEYFKLGLRVGQGGCSGGFTVVDGRLDSSISGRGGIAGFRATLPTFAFGVSADTVQHLFGIISIDAAYAILKLSLSAVVLVAEIGKCKTIFYTEADVAMGKGTDYHDNSSSVTLAEMASFWVIC